MYSEKRLQRILLAGTAISLVALAVLSVDSLGKVRAGRAPALAAGVVRGKHLWNARNCNDCHTILGIGAYFAPDLTTVLQRRDSAWLVRWLTDPRATKPGTTMPPQRLTAAEAADVVAFLGWVGRIDTNGWPPGSGARTGGVVEAGALPTGEALFRQKGCGACHSVTGQAGSGVGPDLGHIATTPYDGLANTPEFLDRWLDNPEAQKPGTLMPSLGLTPAERTELVRYLGTLR